MYSNEDLLIYGIAGITAIIIYAILFVFNLLCCLIPMGCSLMFKKENKKLGMMGSGISILTCLLNWFIFLIPFLGYIALFTWPLSYIISTVFTILVFVKKPKD